ncbi:hypothetical protein [Bacillus wiedmannii]|uniref:hypothetical protein n=1 Tax=Bacillus wiedmannii TaxID=1890302 RepID=UPI000BFE881D|nr:hypothetical protein [Bacillus wiedmannii]PGZ95536.1 hypothetical protein COE63_28535 [Bacillus wiedmannii]
MMISMATIVIGIATFIRILKGICGIAKEVLSVIKEFLDVMERLEKRKEKKQGETKQINKRPVVRHTLPKYRRTTRR